MSRVQSLSYELQIDNDTIYPISIGEFASGGVQNTATAFDGDVEYDYITGIRKVEQIPIEINKKRDKLEYNVMENWCKSFESKDVTIVGRDPNGNAVEQTALLECQCSRDKGNTKDRGSKESEKAKYNLLPRDTKPIS